MSSFKTKVKAGVLIAVATASSYVVPRIGVDPESGDFQAKDLYDGIESALNFYLPYLGASGTAQNLEISTLGGANYFFNINADLYLRQERSEFLTYGDYYRQFRVY